MTITIPAWALVAAGVSITGFILTAVLIGFVVAKTYGDDSWS